MASRTLLRSLFLIAFSAILAGAYPAAASSHARIVRLSLVQGDVRFTRSSHGDPLADSKVAWEAAELNLPIRQGYVLATDNGRAEIEFENGTMAFLSENSVLEFFDLSLQDGLLITRLVLRQGTASVYVNPAEGDYFSVTGGDFTVEAAARAEFRLDDYDDGSNVDVLLGHVSLLHSGISTPLEKGQSLSMKAGENAIDIGRLPDNDAFDGWVSGRIDSVTTATNAALEYTSAPYSAPGFGALSAFGSWSPCGGYGFGWRPFGAGSAWSPFSDGQWVMDPGFGWTWVSYQPWGWAPYHYGGWLFDAGCGGWFYSPPVFYTYFPGVPRRRFPPIVHPPHLIYRPVTAVFVRQKSNVGIVPANPFDKQGKTPLNLEHGVLALSSARGEQVLPVEPGQKWGTMKSPPRETLSSGLVAAAPPTRVSRTMPSAAGGAGSVTMGHNSSIAYDPREHTFVNANGSADASATSAKEARSENAQPKVAAGEHIGSPSVGAASSNSPGAVARVSAPPGTARSSTPPAARITTPPPAPHVSGGERGGFQAGGARGSSGGSSGHSSAGSASHSSSGHH